MLSLAAKAEQAGLAHPASSAQSRRPQNEWVAKQLACETFDQMAGELKA
jgi:hypothetical protein